jgi:hypothetical protein
LIKCIRIENSKQKDRDKSCHENVFLAIKYRLKELYTVTGNKLS